MADIKLPSGTQRTRVPMLIVGALVGMAVGFWVHVYKVENKIYKDDLPLGLHYELWAECTIVGMAIGLAAGLAMDVLVDIVRRDFHFGLAKLFIFVTASAAISATLAPRPRIFLLGAVTLIILVVAVARVLIQARQRQSDGIS